MQVLTGGLDGTFIGAVEKRRRPDTGGDGPGLVLTGGVTDDGWGQGLAGGVCSGLLGEDGAEMEVRVKEGVDCVLTAGGAVDGRLSCVGEGLSLTVALCLRGLGRAPLRGRWVKGLEWEGMVDEAWNELCWYMGTAPGAAVTAAVVGRACLLCLWRRQTSMKRRCLGGGGGGGSRA